MEPIHQKIILFVNWRQGSSLQCLKKKKKNLILCFLIDFTFEPCFFSGSKIHCYPGWRAFLLLASPHPPSPPCRSPTARLHPVWKRCLSRELAACRTFLPHCLLSSEINCITRCVFPHSCHLFWMFFSKQVLPRALPMFGITSQVSLGRLQGAGGADIIPSPSPHLHHHGSGSSCRSPEDGQHKVSVLLMAACSSFTAVGLF